MSFDRLVNNAGLCDDARLGGEASTHTFFFSISVPISLSYAAGVWHISAVFQIYPLTPLALGQVVIFTVHTFIAAAVVDTNTQVQQVFSSPITVYHANTQIICCGALQ